jgi:site-specific DNA-methyltransferase (adenine-specific)
MKVCPNIFAEVTYSKQSLISRKFPQDFVGHIINGECTEVMVSMPPEAVDLVVTSPPYFVNKSYENTWTFDQYCTLMQHVFVQCFIMLKPGGYLVINFGDYFNKDRFYDCDVPSVYPATINFFDWGRDAGFDLQATRIWRKQFSRMSIPFVCNHHPRPVFDYEHIWTFRKPDGTGKEFVNDRKLSQRGVLGDGWSSSAQLANHEAAFPLELPLWAIDVYSKEKDDIVLDPFCGIGTTLIAASERGRKFIGIDISEEHCKAAFRRMRYSDTGWKRK